MVETAIKIELPKIHSGQEVLEKSNARFKVVAKGRRFGGSFYFARELVKRGLMVPGPYWWVWPNMPNALVGWRLLQRLFKPLVHRGLAEINQQYRTIEFNNSLLQIKSAERPNTLRSEGLAGVVITEFSFIPQADRIFEFSIEAALAERKGWAVFESSPWGMDHLYAYFHRCRTQWFYEYGEWPDDYENGRLVKTINESGLEDWEAFQLPTWLNPYVPKEEIERARKSKTEIAYKQEFGSEFVDELGAFFNKIPTHEKAEEKPLKKGRYRWGLDLGQHDPTVLSIGNQMTGQQVALYRWKDQPFEIVFKEVIQKVNEWKCDYGEVDITNNRAFGERLQTKLGYSIGLIHYTNTIKLAMMQELHTAFSMDELSLLEPKGSNKDLTWQLVEFRMMEVSIKAGTLTMKINARAGFHDDAPNAVGLMYKAFNYALFAMGISG